MVSPAILDKIKGQWIGHQFLDMIKGQWIAGEHMSNIETREEFLSDLAFFLADLHSLKIVVEIDSSPMVKIVDKLRSNPPKGQSRKEYHSNKIFCDTAIQEFDKIKDKLTRVVFLHGDLWYKNVIVEHGKLQGLIDWDKIQMGDPHWELRMIRRWIGWDGLEKLLSYYNSSSGENLKSEYIKVLDKIALCNSYNVRILKPNINKPVLVIQDYIQHWPESWWQK